MALLLPLFPVKERKSVMPIKKYRQIIPITLTVLFSAVAILSIINIKTKSVRITQEKSIAIAIEILSAKLFCD